MDSSSGRSSAKLCVVQDAVRVPKRDVGDVGMEVAANQLPQRMSAVTEEATTPVELEVKGDRSATLFNGLYRPPQLLCAICLQCEPAACRRDQQNEQAQAEP